VCEPQLFEIDYPEQFIKELLQSKPEIIKDDNFINNLYEEIALKE